MSAYADSRLNEPVDAHTNDLDLAITRLLIETGGLEEIDCVRFRMGLRWRYFMGCSYIPLALDYLCQQDVVPFDLADILLSSLVEGPLAAVLPDGQLSSFLRIVHDHGKSSLTGFNHQGEAVILGVLPIHLYETFESAKLQKEILNEAVISICMLLSHGFGSPPQPPSEGFLRRASNIVNRDPDFMKVVWELALKLTGQSPQHFRNDDYSANRGDDGEHGSCDDFGTSYEYETSVLEDDMVDKRVPGAWVDEGRMPEGLKIRKFRSVPSDFDGTIWGHQWDPKTYLMSK